MYGYGVPLASLGQSCGLVHACSLFPIAYTLIPGKYIMRRKRGEVRESMKPHSDCELLTLADAARLFQDYETERLQYTNTVHLCILHLVISGLVYSRID